MPNDENIDNFTALYTSYLRFTFGTNFVLTGFLFSLWLSSTNLCCSNSRSKTSRGLSIIRRLLRPVLIWLRRKHAGIIQLSTTLSRCVNSTLKNLVQYDFSQTNMFTFILKFNSIQTLFQIPHWIHRIQNT